MAGCTGACCENFHLPYTLDEIKKKALKGDVANGSKEEFPKLVDMLISTGRISNIFNCKYFDKESKKCLNYENRPVVCQIFPNSVSCSHAGCKEPCIEFPLRRKS